MEFTETELNIVDICAEFEYYKQEGSADVE